MQADIITNPGYSDLFQYNGHYLLGLGEVASTPEDISARNVAMRVLKPPHFKSYILTDAHRAFRFTLAQGKS
jgi:hypothetical protein